MKTLVGAALLLLLVGILIFVSASEKKVCEGVQVAPDADLQSRIQAGARGTTFCLALGIYRLRQPLVPKAGMTIRGVSGTILNGAQVLNSFEQRGSYFVASGQPQQGRLRGRCDLPDQACRHPEAVFVDDEEFVQVMSLDALTSGEFYLDYSSDELYMVDDPLGHQIEATLAPAAIKGASHDVTVRGLTVERFNNPAGAGAIHLYGSGAEIVDNEIRQNGGIGVCLGGEGPMLIGNHIHHNGQMGVCGNGDDMLIADNEIDHNNTQGHRYGWEAGGSKWTNTVNLVVRNNYSHDNRGIGLWTDRNNRHTIYEGNRVERNRAIGIYHEVSYDAVIRSNEISDNGWGTRWWADGSGIKVSSSPDVEIHHNSISYNRNGVALIQYDRSATPSVHGPHITEDNYVHDNLISAGPQAAGIAGIAISSGSPQLCAEGSDNRFQRNTYRLAPNVVGGFRWCGHTLGFEEWRLSHEVDAIGE